MRGSGRYTAVPVLVLSGLVLSAAGCIERPAPSGVEVNASLLVRLVPEIPPSLANTVESLRIANMRIELRNDETREILSEGIAWAEGDPDEDPVAQVELIVGRTAEIDLAGHVRLFGEHARVEWSGLFGPAPVRATQEIWTIPVVMGRGDLPNLTVSSVEVSGLDDVIYEGDVVPLAVTMLGGTQGSEAFWGSRNPSIATVDSDGRVTAVSAGDVTIVAAAGMHSDSTLVRVVPRGAAAEGSQ